MNKRNDTIPVRVGTLQIGGGAPVSVQAMTNTPTADVRATTAQTLELIDAGAELVRMTVNTPDAARAVPGIAARVRDAGHETPLIGDFHYNGHKLLRDHPACAEALDKYRINPGNVGKGHAHDARFTEICAIARDLDKAVRIGVNAGSLDQELLQRMLADNAAAPQPLSAQSVFNRCMTASALQSAERALEAGLAETRIVLSCKCSQPRDLIAVSRDLANGGRQPMHLGLTEAGMGLKGLVWSAAAMGALLEEGIGDTIRVSLTPTPGESRCQEVYAAQELLQSLELRRFSPTVTACPGCGRTSGEAFQRLADETQRFLRAQMPRWRRQYPGAAALHVAVMGCIVNGPGESRAADIGICLPGDNEQPQCPVYVDGVKTAVLEGAEQDILKRFLEMIEAYVQARHGLAQAPARES